MGLHDSGYKLLFSHPHLVESLIRGFVPGPWLDRLDFTSLETVSEAHPRDEIAMRYDDMIWRLRWRGSDQWIYVYLMLEFQSTVHPFMAVRVLDYDAGLYRQIVRALSLKRGDQLPIVLPMVLYRGDKAWNAEEDVFDLIAPAPAEIEPYLPHLRYLLLDANAFPADRLEAMHNPVACLLWLEACETMTLRPIEELDKILSNPDDNELRRAFALWLTTTFLPSRVADANVPTMENLEEVIPMIAESSIDWTAEWRKEGEANLLLRLLNRLYGPLTPEIEERVRSAEADQLLDWGERLVTVDSLEEVFDNGRDG